MAEYNHDSDSIEEATGVDIQDKFDAMKDVLCGEGSEDKSFSQMAEAVEEKFTFRELAVLSTAMFKDLKASMEKEVLSEVLPDGIGAFALDAGSLPDEVKEKLNSIIAEKGGKEGAGMSIQEFKDSGLVEMLSDMKGACMCDKCVAKREAEAAQAKNPKSVFKGEGGHA